MTTKKTDLSKSERRKTLEAFRKKLEAWTGHKRSDTTGPYLNHSLSLMEEENINDDGEHP